MRERNTNITNLLLRLPTSPLEVAASFRRTIPMVMAASEMEVKEITGSMDVAGLQNKHLGPDTKLTEYL